MTMTEVSWTDVFEKLYDNLGAGHKWDTPNYVTVSGGFYFDGEIPEAWGNERGHRKNIRSLPIDKDWKSGVAWDFVDGGRFSTPSTPSNAPIRFTRAVWDSQKAGRGAIGGGEKLPSLFVFYPEGGGQRHQGYRRRRVRGPNIDQAIEEEGFCSIEEFANVGDDGYQNSKQIQDAVAEYREEKESREKFAMMARKRMGGSDHLDSETINPSVEQLDPEYLSMSAEEIQAAVYMDIVDGNTDDSSSDRIEVYTDPEASPADWAEEAYVRDGVPKYKNNEIMISNESGNVPTGGKRTMFEWGIIMLEMLNGNDVDLFRRIGGRIESIVHIQNYILDRLAEADDPEKDGWKAWLSGGSFERLHDNRHFAVASWVYSLKNGDDLDNGIFREMHQILLGAAGRWKTGSLAKKGVGEKDWGWDWKPRDALIVVEILRLLCWERDGGFDDSNQNWFAWTVVS